MNKLNKTDTENRTEVAKGERDWVLDKMGEGSQKVQIFSYIISHKDVMCNTVTLVNNIVVHS